MTEQFVADADASMTVPMQASALRVGGYVVLRGFPCRIIDMTTSKTGKHGGAKIHIFAVDLFSNRKYEEHFMSTDNVDVPIVAKNEYQLVEIDDEDFLSLITAKGTTKEDLKLEQNEVGQQLRELWSSERDGEARDVFVQTLAAMGKEAVVSFRIA